MFRSGLIAALVLAGYAQSIAFNTGVDLYLQPGGLVWCEGGWENRAGGTFQNQGTVHIFGDIQNDDAGQLFVPAPTPGTLVLAGAQQTLSGSFPIRTDTLRLLGTNAKVLATDLYIDRLLDIGDAELRTQTRFAAVRSPEPDAIARRSGFVSSDIGGYLERATDRSSAYLFPVGGHTPLRYRPVEIIPASTSAHRYAVRLANADPTSEGRPRDQRHPNLCEINPLYDHYINRLAGNAPAELRIYYQVGDPITGPVAQWKTALWVPTTAQTIPSGWRLAGWTDFSDPHFAFSEQATQVSVSASDDTIEVGQSVTFTASSQPAAAGYTWNFGQGTVRPGGASETISYDQPGVYSISVTAPPCSDTAIYRLVVIAPAGLFIPNVFSPNGDGINDSWRITLNGSVRDIRWQVYDRWGVLIAQGQGTAARWDGTKGGQPCPEGAYVYVVEVETLSGERFTRSGTVSLLR
ncbi:MAG: gliding motility-associated C-terminal domain-containing protein [Bacteroidia bacterium]|nr:gliding motility-associated C-terminal domain-containing protein [Bacteroidia bacterium]